MEPATRDSVTSHHQEASFDGRIVVAAFDVDKTLTTRDCVVPFLRRVGGWRFVVRLVVRSPQVFVAVVQRRRDRVKSIAARAAVRGRAVTAVDEIARGFSAEVWERRMRHDTVDRLRWHLSQGHRVVLVSASFRNYLEPLADRLGAHAVLATELDHVEGTCTGELRGPNCRAQVKVDRLSAWIASQGWSTVEIHAYGDSNGDRELLAAADHPTWVSAQTIPMSPEGSA